MAQKLIQGDKLPDITFKLADGGTLALPAELPNRYLTLLFYRGHWCPYCRRHLTDYQEHLEELTSLGATVLGASVDSLEDTKALVETLGLTFPMAYGITSEDVAEMDPWHAEREGKDYIQPTELLVLRGGTIFGSLYASGPVGRMTADEVLNSIRTRERRRLEQEAEAQTATAPR